MSSLVSCKRLSMSYGPTRVFEDVSFSINPSERLALIGPNGVGKSSLLRLVAGLESPDSGSIVVSKGACIAYLPQDHTACGRDISIGVYLEEAAGGLISLATELSSIEEQLSQKEFDSVEMDELLLRYSNLQAEYERRGGYSIDHRIEEVLQGLGLGDLCREISLLSLSGGQMARLALAGLLLQQSDILLLDEPTNHLDLAALEWLESYLSSYPHSVLLVSHDRSFLDRVATSIMDLGQDGTVQRFGGSYSEYLLAKEEGRKRAQRAHEAYNEELRRLRVFIRSASFSTKSPGKMRDNNKMAYGQRGERAQQSENRRISRAKEDLEHLIQNPVMAPKYTGGVTMAFQPNPLASACVVRVRGLGFSHGHRVLFENMNREITSRSRICIQGPNGIGKSTLLKIIAGDLAPSKGEVIRAPSAKIYFLRQDGGLFKPEKTLGEVLIENHALDFALLRAELAKVGLGEDELIYRKIRDLSWGQRQRLQVAEAVISRANVLLLDEPSNHLDLETLECLERALRQFEGAVVCATHDRSFVDSFAEDVWIWE